MTDVVNQIAKEIRMGETEQKVRYGMGSTAAIFVPPGYKGKGVLTGVAADVILSAVDGFSPIRDSFYR